MLSKSPKNANCCAVPAGKYLERTVDIKKDTYDKADGVTKTMKSIPQNCRLVELLSFNFSNLEVKISTHAAINHE